MNWLTEGDEPFEQALGLHPDLQQKYLAFLSTLEGGDTVPKDILALCRTRIEQIHGLVPDEALDHSGAAASAALAVAEYIPYQHHQLPDDAVGRVKEAFGDAGCVTLLTALAFFDVSCRLNLTLNGAS